MDQDRTRKRPDITGDLPVDKRACSASEFRTSINEQLQNIRTDVATSSSTTTMDPVPNISEDSDSDSDSGSDSTPLSHPNESSDVDSKHKKFQRIIKSLEKSDPDEVVPALSQLCEALSFCNEDSVGYFPVEKTVPPLVRIAGLEARPDETLLAVRAITYMCDAMPRSAESVVRHGALPVLCARLITIEYMDVAEQCLQALEKISKKQPVPCIEAGSIAAILGYIDFFSESIQRTAVSAVENMCRRFPHGCAPMIMDSLPQLCNMLQYGDAKLVESVAICLIRIVHSFSSSPALLDKLCHPGILHKIILLIGTDGRNVLTKLTYMSIIGVLTKLASGSLVAVKALLELNIGNSLKNIFVDDLSYGGQYSQIHEALKLVNQLIPPKSNDLSSTESILAKEKFLTEHPDLFCQFAKDILPVLIKAVNSGSNLHVSYGCISVVSNIFHVSTADMLHDMLQDINISSFLAGLLLKRNHHVLFSALKAVEILMQKIHDFFLTSFIKEGGVHSIDSLLMRESPQNSENQSSSPSSSRCLCYIFDSLRFNSDGNSEAKSCQIGDIFVFAKQLKGKYFAPNFVSSEMGLTEISYKLKSCCQILNEFYQHEEYLSDVLSEVLKERSGGETMTNFEFVESGIIKSLANYLTNGKYLNEKIDSNSLDHYISVSKRFKSFARICLKRKENDNKSNETLLTLLVRKLQSALSSFDLFPVILSRGFRHRPVRTEIPVQRYTGNPYIWVSFVKEEDELELNDFDCSACIVDCTSNLAEIERYVWSKVGKFNSGKAKESDKVTNHENGGLDPSSSNLSDEKDSISVENEELESVDKNSEPKIILKLKGKKLSRSIPLYQSILYDQMSLDSDVISGPKLWTNMHIITYCKSKETTQSQPDNPLPSTPPVKEITGGLQWHRIPFFSSLLQADFPCDLPRSSPSFDILFMLRTLEGMNNFSSQLLFEDKIDLFSQGKLTELDEIKPNVSSPVPNEEFMNTNLTEKLEQQIRDPLALKPSGFPSWCMHLMQTSPFLFSLDTRQKYFKLMNFGNLMITPNEDGDSNGDLSLSRRSKEKFEVDRNNILISASKMMDSKARNRALLEIEYSEEVGTGLGPTIEFYTLIGQEFQKIGLGMWRGDIYEGVNENRELGFVESQFGLFPRPRSGELLKDLKKKFVLLGQTVAKAIKDGRILDIPFSRAFYKAILDQELSTYDIMTFDPNLGRILMEFEALAERREYLMKSNSSENQESISNLIYRNVRIDDLEIDFCVPGYEDYVLSSQSSPRLVRCDNLKEYIEMVIDATVKSGVSAQLEAFRSGFNQVFPLSALKVFTEEELDNIICGQKVNWNFAELLDNIKFDHGYTPDSPPVLNLLEIMQEFDMKERRAFLQFLTGSPRLPPGGLASLNPKLTVVRKHFSGDTDILLPSVMTCANYLKLPAYSTKEKMRERLIYAITEGQGSFHLS